MNVLLTDAGFHVRPFNLRTSGIQLQSGLVQGLQMTWVISKSGLSHVVV
jgi:hypothetical protein